MYWLRPGLERSGPFPAAFVGTPDGPALDAALFDVDGVLIDVSGSYRLSAIAATEHIVRRLNALAAPDPLVTFDDVAAFKLAGGFNSDWDLTQALAGLWTARLREWRGTPAAHIPLAEWAARAKQAAQEGHGGLRWLYATVPDSALLPFEEARWVHDEFYWGADLMREMYGREPTYAPDAPGVVHNEEMLLLPEVLPALLRLGVARFGLVTGRVGPEVGRALRALVAATGLREGDDSGIAWAEGEHGRSPFGVVVSADLYAKPDPRALEHAVRTVGARGAVYVGDTADDLAVVLRYRAELQPGDATLPPVLAAMIAEGEAAEHYRAQGADIVLAHIRDLPTTLAALAPGAGA